MKILVLQHADVEHPGSFRRLLPEDGCGRDERSGQPVAAVVEPAVMAVASAQAIWSCVAASR